MSTETAVRNPKRGKAHRYDYKPSWAQFQLLRCGANDRDMTERIPVEQTAPEDRCRRCFPEPASSEREGQR